jgi:hypothetical protein
MKIRKFTTLIFLAGLSILLVNGRAKGVGPGFQTECGDYNGVDTVTFIYPLGEKSAVEDCVFVNPQDPSEFQCTDGGELGHNSVCITDQQMYDKIPKLFAVILGCGFDKDCQESGHHQLIYRNFTNVDQPDTLTHDDDDIDFTHIHFPDLDAPRPKGVPANLWAIQAVFPCDEEGCGPQVRIERMPTTLAEVKEMIDEGKLFAFPFPKHYPVLLGNEASCPNMVLRIPIVKQACDPTTHHVY